MVLIGKKQKLNPNTVITQVVEPEAMGKVPVKSGSDLGILSVDDSIVRISKLLKDRRTTKSGVDRQDITDGTH